MKRILIITNSERFLVIFVLSDVVIKKLKMIYNPIVLCSKVSTRTIETPSDEMINLEMKPSTYAKLYVSESTWTRWLEVPLLPRLHSF
jgi:hypothetical protein